MSEESIVLEITDRSLEPVGDEAALVVKGEGW